MKKLTHLYIVAFLALTLGLMLSCAKKDDGSSSSDNSSSSSDNSSSSSDNSSPFTVSEITQTVGSDGLYSGSFVIPDNGISFLLSIFLDNNNSVAFKLSLIHISEPTRPY